MLDPLSIEVKVKKKWVTIYKVEDINDDGDVIPDGEDANNNGIEEGDRVEMDVATWDNPQKLNPYNIDNDDFVELPQQIGVVPTDLVHGTKTENEATTAEVYQHIITHEAGHAVGMGNGDPQMEDSLGHCFDKDCVMYQYSIDWKRADHFCPYHQNMIKIHNN